MNIDDTLPKMIIYPLGKKDINKFVQVNNGITGQELAHSLLNWVYPDENYLNENSTREDDPNNVEFFVKQQLGQNRYPIIFFYDHSDPKQRLFLNSYSNIEKYKKYLRFGRMANPCKFSFQNYQIQGLPDAQAVLSAEGLNYQKANMIFKQKEYYQFILYFDNIRERKITEDINKLSIFDLNQPKEFDNKCKFDNQPCILALLNAYKQGKFKIEIYYLEQTQKKFAHQNINWGWVDGNCHPELLKAFKINEAELSTLVYFDDLTKRQFITLFFQLIFRYRIFRGEFLYDDINEFMEEIFSKSGKQFLQKLANEQEIKLQDTAATCDSINKQLQELANKKRNQRQHNQAQKTGSFSNDQKHQGFRNQAQFNEQEITQTIDEF